MKGEITTKMENVMEETKDMVKAAFMETGMSNMDMKDLVMAAKTMGLLNDMAEAYIELMDKQEKLMDKMDKVCDKYLKG